MEKKLTAQFFIKEASIAQFKELTSELIKNTRQEAGNIAYNLYQSVEDASQFLFVETFKDQAAFDTHSRTPHFKKFIVSIKTIQKQEPILTHLS